MRKLINLLSWPVVAVLLLFTVRRWLFAWVALTAGRAAAADSPPVLPEVLLLAPFRNEAAALPELLAALARLDYPASQLTVVFVDDGSGDGVGRLVGQYLDQRANWHLLSLPETVGKAGALNAALACFPQGEIIAVYDADERPHPDALRQLVAPFGNPAVGGVSGRRQISNLLASPAASYTTFEGLVHQQVTMRAKDWLNLAPAILGSNCAYRRAALEQVGGFQPGALLEDTDITLKLARGGWRLRFTPAAVSCHRAPESVAGYWQQHTRWARGFNDVAASQSGALWRNPSLPLPLRLELFAFALGYLDRLALVAAGVLSLAGSRPARVALLVSLLSPLGQIAAALKIDGQPAAVWLRLVWVPLFFAIDVAMALAGVWHTLANSPRIWEERRLRR